MTRKNPSNTWLIRTLAGACAMVATAAFAQDPATMPPQDPQQQQPLPPTSPTQPIPPAPPAEPPMQPTVPPPTAQVPPPSPAGAIPPADTPVTVRSSPPDSISKNYRVDFTALDRNSDGAITRSEVGTSGNPDLMREFHVVDSNHNGQLTQEEMQGWLD